MNELLITQAPEQLEVKPVVEVEVTEIHTLNNIEVNHTDFDVSSSEYHIPTMKALGRVAVKTK